MLPLEIISKILILRGHHPESKLINELINRLKFYLLTPISEGGGNFNTLPVYKKSYITLKLLVILYNNSCM
jgi:hypothetical protein